MGESIEFNRPDGKSAPGYLAGDTDAKMPGIVMFEEWWGVTDHIRSTADQLASSGFRVLVPDLFRGRSAATGDEANHLMEGLDFGDAATQDGRGAAQYLQREGAKVGVLGFCMGGALTLLAAMYDPEFSAAVSFYGYPPPEAGDAGSVKIPVQGHWALHDEHFSIDGVDRIEKRLNESGRPHEFYRYDAQHAFHNPNQPGHAGLGHYHREYAELAWSRTVEFFKKYLQ